MNKCCGNCKHWRKFEGKPYGLQIGDCCKITKGTNWTAESKSYVFDGICFEDNCYDNIWHCFEPKEENMQKP